MTSDEERTYKGSPRSRRRADGTYQAYCWDMLSGEVTWECEHQHPTLYGRAAAQDCADIYCFQFKVERHQREMAEAGQ